MRQGASDPDPVTVLTVDDQEVFRRTMHSLVQATPGFEHVGEAASGPEALERAAELKPDLVLLDIRMPGMDGFETARRLAGSARAPLVVLVSLDATARPPDGSPAAAYVCKQDLSTVTLREVWAAHRPRDLG